MLNSQNKTILPLLVILLIPIIIFLFNFPVAIILWRYGFDDGSYSHAFLIPLIYTYLCFNLHQNNQLEFRHTRNIAVLSGFILSCYLFFVVSSAQITLAYLVAHILLILSTTIVLYKFSWRLIFPAIYLVFMYTLWGPLVPLLQTMSVTAVSFMMSFTGIPTFVEYQFVTIPAGVFEIAGGCSGLRYLITALSISFLYIFLYLNKIKHILLFLSVAIAGALLTNWIRISIIIIIGHYTEMTSELIHDHNMFGWYIFIPFIYLLFKFGNTLISDELKNKPITGKNVPNLALLAISVGGIILSSLLLHNLLQPLNSQTTIQNVTNQIKETNNIQLFPIIHYYSQVSKIEKQINNINFTQYTYQFNAQDLDSKASNFSNKLFNEGWQESDSIAQTNQPIQIITNNHKNAIIAVNYLIDGQNESSITQFKLLRLKKALLGKNKTQLQWIGKICEADCVEEKNALLKYIKNNF